MTYLGDISLRDKIDRFMLQFATHEDPVGIQIYVGFVIVVNDYFIWSYLTS